MTTSPQESVIFVSAFSKGDEGGIHAFSLNRASGALKPLHRTGDVEEPFYLALSRDRRFLYSIHRFAQGGVASYAIEPGGVLKLINRVASKGAASCYLDIDASGRALLVASYSGGTVSALPVKADGSVGEPTCHLTHTGTSVNASRQESPHPHCIVVSPNSRHAYVADLGIDKIVGYTLDAAAAKLTPNRQPFVRVAPGSGPRHLTFHPSKPWAYLINELLNTVTLFHYDAADGTLIELAEVPTLPAGTTVTSHTADVKVTPDGRFLYGTNRGHDSITAFSIGDDGRLSLIGNTPSGCAWPQNLAITRDGKWLICANMNGNGVTVFAIDPNVGKVTQVGAPVPMPKPSCVMEL